MENLKEFKELIKKYESITLEKLEACKKELEGEYDCGNGLDKDEISDVLENITNFGTKSCSLCKALGLEDVGSIKVCQDCTWLKLTNDICYDGVNRETYDNIEDSTSILDLKEAINKRAEYMKKVLTNKKED